MGGYTVAGHIWDPPVVLIELYIGVTLPSAGCKIKLPYLCWNEWMTAATHSMVTFHSQLSHQLQPESPFSKQPLSLSPICPVWCSSPWGTWSVLWEIGARGRAMCPTETPNSPGCYRTPWEETGVSHFLYAVLNFLSAAPMVYPTGGKKWMVETSVYAI